MSKIIGVLFFCVGLSYAAIDPESIVGMWTLDEGNGIEVKDVSGNNRHGTFSGEAPNWVDGKFGYAIDFDTFGEVVRIPNFSVVAPVKDITITFWTKLGDVANDNDVLSFDPISSDRLTVHFPWGGNVIWIHGNARFVAGEIPNETLNNWEFWAFIRSSNENYMRVIRNTQEFGFKRNVPPFPKDGFANGEVEWNIGGRKGSSYTGIIDEVGVFNTVLSDNDLADIMSNGLAQAAFPVSPLGKMAAVWGKVKSRAAIH